MKRMRALELPALAGGGTRCAIQGTIGGLGNPAAGTYRDVITVTVN